MMWPLCRCQVVNGWESTISSWTQVSVMMMLVSNARYYHRSDHSAGARKLLRRARHLSPGNTVDHRQHPSLFINTTLRVSVHLLFQLRALRTKLSRHNTTPVFMGAWAANIRGTGRKQTNSMDWRDTEFVQMTRWIMKLVMEISSPQRMRRFSRLLPHQPREKEERILCHPFSSWHSEIVSARERQWKNNHTKL